MAGNAGFGDEPLAPGCYSQLLFGDENSGLETDGLFGFSSAFDENINAPKMLCFGDYATENGKKTGQKQKPGSACMDPPTKNISKKRNGSVIEDPADGAGAPPGRQRNGKKPKSENARIGGHAKVVKKEKLGERITALQQLVSPYGKTDTASVLHEALGYIRFLHDQVQVLCSPYLQCWSSSSSEAPHCPITADIQDDGEGKKSERSSSDLRSKGLCLVPVDLTLHVADSNGADLWSSAAMADTVSSS